MSTPRQPLSLGEHATDSTLAPTGSKSTSFMKNALYILQIMEISRFGRATANQQAMSLSPKQQFKSISFTRLIQTDSNRFEQIQSQLVLFKDDVLPPDPVPGVDCVDGTVLGGMGHEHLQGTGRQTSQRSETFFRHAWGGVVRQPKQAPCPTEMS